MRIILLILRKLKWFPIYGYLKFIKRKLKPMFSYNHNTTDLEQLGVLYPADARLKEYPRELLPDENAIDSFHLWGCDLSGNVLMVNISRRHGRKADVYVYIRLENGDEYQLPNQPDVQVINTDGKFFSVRGLTIECLEPLRIWRVNFNGRLRKGIKQQWDTDDNDDTISVCLNAIWHPMYNYAAFPLDFNLSLMSDVLSKYPWTRDMLKSYHIGTTEWHEQWGQLHGVVKIGDKEHKLLIQGTKLRENGISRLYKTDKLLSIKGISSIALGFELYAKSQNDKSMDVFFGNVAPPSGEKLFSVQHCHIDNVEHFFEDNANNEEIHIKLIANNRKYDVVVKLRIGSFNLFVGDNWDHQGKVVVAEMTINGKSGIGIVETYQSHAHGSPLPKRESIPQLREPENNESDELVLSLHDRSCQSSKIVGGKGASLALMMTIKDKISQFQIPDGICLTKRAFENHLKSNPGILQSVLDMQDIAWKKKPGRLEEGCQKVENSVKNSEFCSELSTVLQHKLKDVFGDSFEDFKFAVRSSAIGEDGEDLSAAGQNETLLGVKTFDKICEAILKCWASQFSFQSVEYKRQNGQLLNGGMGVVVQKMVPADVAGVLFTRDPMTGSMDVITITSNYGLGESVVSASINPDMVLLKRSWSDNLSICEKSIGKKEFKIVMSDAEGTVQTPNNDEDSIKCTLSNDMAYKLGKIAVALENSFGSPRDVEWAIRENEIFVLQARPVTSGNEALTRFDVFHEFDSSLRTPREHYSIGNVGEVMPGASSTFTITGNLRAQGVLFLKMFTRKAKTFRYDPSVMDGGGAVFYSRIFFDLVQQKMSDPNEKKSVISKAAEVGLYGKILDDKEAVKIAMERFDAPPSDLKYFMIRMMAPGMFKGSKIIADLEKTYSKYAIPLQNAQTAKETFEVILSHMLDMDDVLMKHLHVTFASMIWNTLILVLLSGGTSDFSQDHYADFASLIGSSLGAESGDVPVSLRKIALEVAKEMDRQKFTALSPDDALSWLTKGQNSASVKFQQFLKKHGHRGLKEFDVISVSWGMNPLLIVKILQAMLKMPIIADSKESLSVADCLKGMKTEMSYLKKKLLEWLVHRSRNAVCYREKGKSLLIYYTHQIRLALRCLAELMVHEGYIPNEEYVYFFSIAELREFLKTRAPRLILRARSRKRHYKEMDSFRFPEISIGFPVPLNSGENEVAVDNTSEVSGLPVCYGVVKGTARVILSFREVDTIQPNEILITQATDIGWSPYFPILGGVVTEIGGLVSHGAVVAREYGLPCIIGAENATKVFKSGDVVLLDATNGKIMKVVE